MASIIGVETLQHTNGTTAATIDSSGRIITSARPAFIAKVNSTKNMSGANTPAILTYDVADLNVGSHFDISTGKLTAPVAGLYQFNFSLLLSNVSNSDDSIHVELFQSSDTGQAEAHFERAVGEAATGSYYGFGGYLPVSGSAMLNLAQNEEAYIRFYSGGTISVYGSTGDGWGRFDGYLVG